MSKSKKNLSKEEVKHISKLVNLDLTGEELSLYAKQLSQTLDYIENLNQIKTDKVAPTYQTTGNKNRYLEEKQNERTFKPEEALQNASAKKNNLFQVPLLNYQK